MDENKKLGHALREYREKNNKISILDFAKEIGVNPVYITQIERHGKMPSSAVFNEIIKHLAVDEDTKAALMFKYLVIKNPEVADTLKSMLMGDGKTKLMSNWIKWQEKQSNKYLTNATLPDQINDWTKK